MAIDRNHRWIVQHDPLATDVDQRVGSSKVNANIIRYQTKEGQRLISILRSIETVEGLKTSPPSQGDALEDPPETNRNA